MAGVRSSGRKRPSGWLCQPARSGGGHSRPISSELLRPFMAEAAISFRHLRTCEIDDVPLVAALLLSRAQTFPQWRRRPADTEESLHRAGQSAARAAACLAHLAH